MITLDQVFGGMRRGSGIFLYDDDEVDFRPFAFVLNVRELAGADRIEIAPGYTLRRAQKKEIEYIREFVTQDFGRKSYTAIWETRPAESGEQPKLPKKLWRYYVIEFADDDPNLDLLEAALATAPVNLEIGFAKLRVDLEGVVRPVCLYRVPSLFQSVSALDRAGGERDRYTISLGKTEGDEIRELFVRMAAHDSSILDINPFIELLLELKDLPTFSPLQVLGYFAILESVLTHQPNPDDRYESITRQITQKLALLNKRWCPALDYGRFGGANHDKIWSKMYAYRSAIAHGRKPDFKSQLAILKSVEAANDLVRDAVRKTIRHAFAEPQLVADLHHV